MTRDKLEFDGEVVDFSNGIFKVKVSDNYFITATLSGKIRQNAVKILMGDIVRCEISEYDTTRGRITYRHKGA